MSDLPERVLVCGGRDYADETIVFRVLDESRPWFAKQFCIIVGGARGVDRFARHWAESRGICCIVVNAQWHAYGMSAGPIRNTWMLKFCRPQLVIAFPGGKGTEDMVKQAHAASLDVYAIR